MPTPTKSGSEETRRPRRSASHSSDWYLDQGVSTVPSAGLERLATRIGTVLVSTPVPMPVM